MSWHKIKLPPTTPLIGMADDVDLHQVREEFLHQHLLSFRFPSLIPTGQCHFCAEPVKEGHFCDADCRDDYEKQEYFRRQQPQ